ncbi:rhamnosyltransferase [Paraburkholderia sp. GAS199]|uniref:glycosyltransferase family 2 protein n=1 Tax=Paraburkholderia sp. GAS199 TaxID=3035126 RepID=UPI003D1BB563
MSSLGNSSAGIGERPRVAAVIVSYNPEVATVAAQTVALARSVQRIVIVDNGSKSDAKAELAELASRADGEFIPLGGNLGIAAAQNRGIEAAKRWGAEYVLLLDHDSIPDESMVDRLVAASRKLVREGVRLAAVGPVTVDRRTGSRNKFMRATGLSIMRPSCEAGCEYVETDFLIASGTLVRMEVFDAIGTMNEGYFIDHVDTEWCLRARARDWRIFGICDAELQHSLGDSIVRVWFGHWREVFVHSPFRDYYAFRNTVVMLRSTPMSRGWQLWHVVRLVQFWFFFGIALAPRLKRLRLMAQGLRDGFAGRMGPLNDQS